MYIKHPLLITVTFFFIRLGLMKHLVKALNKYDEGFKLLFISETLFCKIKEGIFVGPDIRKVTSFLFVGNLNELEISI